MYNIFDTSTYAYQRLLHCYYFHFLVCVAHPSEQTNYQRNPRQHPNLNQRKQFAITRKPIARASPHVPALITHCSIEYSKREWTRNGWQMGNLSVGRICRREIGSAAAAAGPIFPRASGSFCFPGRTPITNSMEQAHLAGMLRISFWNNALEFAGWDLCGAGINNIFFGATAAVKGLWTYLSLKGRG